MPIHDWSRLPSALFHDFHQSWTVHLKNRMNKAGFGKGLNAFVASKCWPSEPAATADDNLFYADKANRILVRHHLGRIVAVIELVSPGNKDTKRALWQFVEKIGEYLEEGIHVLVVDLFPPSKRDPQGIHKAIWDEVCEVDFVLPPGKDRTLASYKAGSEKIAYVEPVALGADIPDMPLYLFENFHIPVPLEEAYRETWYAYPEDMREIVETGVMPNADDDE